METSLVSPGNLDNVEISDMELKSESNNSNSSVQSFIAYIKEEDILGFSRKPHTCISVFILMTMSFINLFINKFIYNDINPLKVLLAITPLVYFNVMFLNIVAILKQFKYRSVLKNTMIYFHRRFASSVVSKDYSENLNFEAGGAIDYRDNLIYVGQLIKSIEEAVYKWTRKVWPFFFGSMIFYTVFLYIYSVYWTLHPKYDNQNSTFQVIGSLITGFS